MTDTAAALLILAAIAVASGCDVSHDGRTHAHAATAARDSSNGHDAFLVPATAKLDRVNDVARDPNSASFSDELERQRVVRGYEIVRSTHKHAPELTGNDLTCGNCHLNSGQRDHSLPFVGVARRYPEFCVKRGENISLGDQIVECAERHLNADPVISSSDHVSDIVAYIEWLSRDVPDSIARRAKPSIDSSALLPISKLDPKRGGDLFAKKCSQCHGSDGQGVDLAIARPGPLWGARSWSDGGDAGRVYVLASFIRRSMPLLNPGAMTDEEAQQIAAFINSKDRPHFRGKERDYRATKIPSDAVYYSTVSSRAR